MSLRSLSVAAAALFVAHAANATVYFDTVNVTDPTFGKDGNPDTGIALADSFTANTPDFSQVSLLLSADNPADHGSVIVYLIPDNGTGSLGVAGSPAFSETAGVFSHFDNAVSLATISDGNLAKTGVGTTLVSINFSPMTAASVTTLNDEYWIGLVSSANSTAEWYFGSVDDGVGVANQSSFYALAGGGTAIVLDSFFSPSGGPYDLIVSTPEPGSLAVFGAAVAGLACIRRRKPAPR